MDEFAKKLQRLEQLYVRGYDVEGGSVAYQDKVSQPTVVSNVWQVSPHLFKFKRPNFWPNFGLILADSGRALVVDCGLLDEKFLDAALDGLRQHFGLKAIDAVIITHMHGDHFLEAPHLREKWGAPIWALDNMVDKMEHPERFDYAAPIQAYGKKNPDGSPMNGVRVDRAFKPGETFDWEGHRFTVDWMPGQTEFALCLHGRIDGRKVAFTGDNIFGDPDDPTQTGHEAMVAHNSAILEEGYIYGAEYLRRLQPDILVGGHSFVMDRPAKFIERYRRWSYEMREAFQALSPEKDYRYWFDPFWVRAEPYRLTLRGGETATVNLHLRNFRSVRQTHRIEIHAPPGLIAEPSFLEGRLPRTSQAAFPIRVRATARRASPACASSVWTSPWTANGTGSGSISWPTSSHHPQHNHSNPHDRRPGMPQLTGTTQAMTSRERVLCAARRQPVDRIPVAPYMGNHGARVAGVRIGDYCRSGRLMAEAQHRAWQIYGQDVLVAQSDGYYISEGFGVEVEHYADATPTLKTPAVQELGDVFSLRVPDPRNDGRMPVYLEAISRLSGMTRGEVAVRAPGTGPFSLASYLLGTERFLRRARAGGARARRSGRTIAPEVDGFEH